MVSIIIPSYNHAQFLKERIDSVLNQTYKDFELIILDDKSPDNSKEIIEQYRGNPHISHIVYNEENSGSTFKQWNKGVGLAKGEYIWIAESDDYADPNLLQTLLDNIQNNNNIVLSYCESYETNKSNEIMGDWSFRTKDIAPELFSKDFTMIGTDFIRKYLIIKNIVPNASGVLFRKDIFLQVGGANTDIGYIADWACWLKILTLGNVAFTQQKLNYFRKHEKSVVALTYNNPDEVILKKHEIAPRLAYRKFLIKLKQKNKSIIALKQLNGEYLEDALFVECRYAWVHKKYWTAIKYFFLIARFSQNRSNIIRRGINTLRKK